MSGPTAVEVLRQHLIDPEICIRCNTCEETCPVDAITHDSRNYVVDAGEVQLLQRRASRPARPARSTTGGRSTARSRTRSPSSSPGTRLPAQDDARRRRRATTCRRTSRASRRSRPRARAAPRRRRGRPRIRTSTCYTLGEAGDRDGHRQLPLTARRRVARHPPHRARLRRHRVSRCSRARRSASSRRASTRTAGRTTCACTRSRARATASARATTTSSLTVKRVTEDHDGKPVRGVASNYLCDLAKGDDGARSSARSARAS